MVIQPLKYSTTGWTQGPLVIYVEMILPAQFACALHVCMLGLHVLGARHIVTNVYYLLQ